MKIACVILGTRGDVQPMIALSTGLMKKGHEVMAAASRVGIPQAAFPFMGDQFDNRRQIVKLGLGPNTCDFKKITPESISLAITECISNGKYKKNAEEISQRLQNVNGIELTIQLIEKEFKK